MENKHLSVWYFVGLLLLIYGVLILGAGIYEAMTPSANTVVLAHLHVGIWWGAVLTIVGGIYTFLFSPRRQR